MKQMELFKKPKLDISTIVHNQNIPELKGYIVIDFETCNSVDLKKVSFLEYVRHKDLDMVLVSYSIDGGDVKLSETIPHELDIALQNHEYKIIAHNAIFEYFVLRSMGYNIPLENFICTMALTKYYGCKGSLENASVFWDVELKKQKLNGEMRLFTNIYTLDLNVVKYPTKWQTYCEYCLRDTVATCAIAKKCINSWGLVQSEFMLDYKINQRGYKINDSLLKKLQELFIVKKNECINTFKDTYGFLPTHNNFKNYLNSILETTIESTDKSNLQDLLTTNPELEDIVFLFQTCIDNNGAKIKTLADKIYNHRLTHTLNLYGANTGRWSGKGFNIQAMPKGTPLENMDTVIDDILRGNGCKYSIGELMGVFRALIQCDNETFIISDFSAIEPRVIATLTDNKVMLDAYAKGEDLYKSMASAMFGTPYSEVTKEQRSMAKCTVLGCGYGMGYNKFSASNKLPLEQSKMLVEKYRGVNSVIVQAWYELDEMAKDMCLHPEKTYNGYGCTFGIHKDSLSIKLPSNRYVFFHGIELKDGELVYYGDKAISKTKKVKLWGGKIFQRIIQATARDILQNALFEIDKEGLEIAFHVHDEVVVDAKESDKDTVHKIMCTPPSWLPNLPLQAETFTSKYYKK